MVTTDLKTTFNDSDIIQSGFTSTPTTQGSLNTIYFHVNHLIGSADVNLNTNNTHDGSLSLHAGSLVINAGSLSTHAGSLSTQTGSLTLHAGSLSTHASQLSTISSGSNFAEIKFLTGIQSDTITKNAQPAVTFTVGTSVPLSYTISGGTLESGDQILVIADVHLRKDETLNEAESYEAYTDILIDYNDGIAQTSKSSLKYFAGMDMEWDGGALIFDQLQHSGGLMYTFTIPDSISASNDITVTTQVRFSSPDSSTYKAVFRGNMLIFALRNK